MSGYVALLRGINVGGHNKLPMAEFRSLLTGLGCEDVATYIQSGNAVFRHAADCGGLSDLIPEAIEKKFGFRPETMMFDEDRFRQVADENPYRNANVKPNFMHVFFLANRAGNADLERLDSLKVSDEEFSLTNSAFYLLTPDGIGTSKLGAAVEKCLGVAATARNWRSVSKLVDMLDALG